MGQNCREDDVRIWRKQTSSLPCHESIVQRSAQKKAKAVENCRYTIVPIWIRLKLFFAQVNQLSLYGAVAEMWEEYETFHDRTGQPVVGGQSSSAFVPSVIKTEVLLDCDDLALKDLLLQQYGERNEKLSQQDRLSKFCKERGFLNVVEIGQYFMTKDTAEFSQFRAAACREYTLPRDEETSQPKGWIQGKTKIGLVLEVATCCLQGKYGVEIRIMSTNEDNSQSWVRISHGSNKFVTNLNNNEQEISEVQLEEYALKLKASDFCMPNKGQSKTTQTRTCRFFHKNNTYWRKKWTDVEPGEYSIFDYAVSKKLILFFVMQDYLEKMLERLNSGESKTIFRNISCIVIIGLTTSGRKTWQEEEEETRTYTNIVLIHQEQSCTSELFKAIQDAVSLILLYSTMFLFRTASSSTFIMSDVQSIYIPSLIRG